MTLHGKGRGVMWAMGANAVERSARAATHGGAKVRENVTRR